MEGVIYILWASFFAHNGKLHYAGKEAPWKCPGVFYEERKLL
jgi:hypothetical protein